MLFRTIAHLLPMFLQMLKDEYPDVRLHIISKLELVNKGKDSQPLSQDIVQLSDYCSYRYRTLVSVAPPGHCSAGRG